MVSNVTVRKDRTYSNRINLTPEWKAVIDEVSLYYSSNGTQGLPPKEACEKYNQSWTTYNNRKKTQHTDWKEYYVSKVGDVQVISKHTPSTHELFLKSMRIVNDYLKGKAEVEEKTANFALRVIATLKSGVKMPELPRGEDSKDTGSYDSRIDRVMKEKNCTEEEAILILQDE